MTIPRAFDPVEPIPAGRSAIEASAGTGKTFTIASQVVRLIAEEGVEIDRILVVTFTKAATAELEDRIRRRLRTTGHALEGRPVPRDEHIDVLLDTDPATVELRRRRIRTALAGFDRSHIHTIHGFALRILGALGFYSRLGADVQPGEIDADLVRSAVIDLIAARFVDKPADLIDPATLASIAATVMDRPDARIVPDPAVGGIAGLRADLALHLRADLRRRLAGTGSVGYDELLLEARAALSDKRTGEAARSIIRARFDAALVDESQDTDPVQWQIIRSVFDESDRLVIIGDPKQSIYGFRGADIESYLSAAGSAAQQRTLPRNWRSDGPLISALNTMLAGVEFGDRRIRYLQVAPADAHRDARMDGIAAPVVVRRFGDDYPIGRYTKEREKFLVGSTREAVADDCGDQIVQLLHSGATIETDLGPRPVGPGDIAVLCRTRVQVELVRAALDARGVPSVASRSGSVFTSPAAEQWRRFLHGLERPDIMSRVRLAATSDLYGLDPGGLVSLGDDDVVEIQTRMRRWRDLLHESGVPALFAAVDKSTGLASRLLSTAEGERTLTDITHLAEAMHAAWRTRRIGSLLGWLEAEMVDAAAREASNSEEVEARQRRLETDAAAVQVQTIHGAKGLEYAVVYAPYLWDMPVRKPSIPVFHDPGHAAQPGRDEPRPRLVDVGGETSPNFDVHQGLARDEDAAEESRLLYVALTRAKHHLVLWWINQVPSTVDSKLHAILTGHGGPALAGLLAAANGTIVEQVSGAPPPLRVYRPAVLPPPGLGLATLDRKVDATWRRVSYSRLSPDHPVSPAADTGDRPLRADEREAPDAAPLPSVELPMAALPVGARFGTLVHEILEHVPFDAPDLEAVVREQAIAAMTRSRWDLEVDDLVAGLAAAIRTPLTAAGGAPRLRDLDSSRMLKEMWFDLPVRTDAAATTIGELGAVMRDHLESDDPVRDYAATLSGMRGEAFRGFLVGSIDLAAVIPFQHGDRYAVMDFKSNVIAARGEAPVAADFGPAPLTAEMVEGHYYLQAVLYQVAMHRYLQWRLPDYDPATHLGGSAYLFVRGMIGPGTPVIDGARAGVHWWTPPAELIVTISRHFVDGGAS